MSDTPETDAAVAASGGDWSPVLRAVAQRLERERDEALNAIYNYKLEVEAWELLAQARRERDEAREALRELWQTADAYIPQIDEEQTTKWHNAMGAPHNLAKSEMNCRTLKLSQLKNVRQRRRQDRGASGTLPTNSKPAVCPSLVILLSVA